MKVVFYVSDKPKEVLFAQALGQGIRGAGDEFEVRRTADYGDDRLFEGPTLDTDVAVAVGVKGQSRRIIFDHLALGRGTLYADKGYLRAKGGAGELTRYIRIVVNGSDATSYFQATPRSPERFESLGMRIEQRRKVDGGHVLFCGSSQKYGDFHALGDVTRYAEKALARLRKYTERQLVYRPKPSWAGAVPVAGAAYSPNTSTLTDALRQCHCLVTHGSNAALEAVLAGVPVMVLGDGIAAPIATHEIEHIENPHWSNDDVRVQWAADMAWTQFTTEEMRGGFAWSVLREQLHAAKCALSASA